MQKWTINGALILGFQGLMGAMAGQYAADQAVLVIAILCGVGATIGALLWRFLTPEELTQQTISQPLQDS